ncbi:MAG: MaoC/PaaZ C-terminal domain-containing protein [Acidobacteriota bacterium]|nr:MaoC/PaaZ C-terminal domain-containing protein [Blastocatellia bacterium]MDW8241323.1 MaoC/PaaZ C-terminal domain-containing protein [Acidobacteriota bacterium]
MGKFFDELEPGQEFVSAGRTITEADIINFAGLTGDWSELHVNREFADKGYFGQRIAHGALTFSISTGLAVRMGLLDDVLIAFYGIDRLRFRQPVFIGDTLWVRKRVESKEDRDEHSGLLTFATEVVNQRQQVVLSYQDKVLLKKAG